MDLPRRLVAHAQKIDAFADVTGNKSGKGSVTVREKGLDGRNRGGSAAVPQGFRRNAA
jgi:hypothetical protein